MTAPTTTRSAYPATVDDLIPAARDLAAELGELPTRNKLMKTFKVGAPKANAVLAALAADPAPVPAADVPATPPPLTLVPDLPAHPHPSADDTPPDPQPAPDAEPVTAERPTTDPADDVAQAADDVPVRRPVTWPVLILCLPAFVAIWGGWVEMGRLTGFGMVKLLPGIADSVELNTAITLPIGVETYAAYALYVWLSGRATGDARSFAKWSALASLALGAAGQVAYHLMAAAGWTTAPWPITAAVACIPVAVLGMGAALAHLMHNEPR
jgi:hypothetical protein